MVNEEPEDPKQRTSNDEDLASGGVDSSWTREELLEQEGIFFLEDIVALLDLDLVRVKQRVREMENLGKPAWEWMGVRKIWNSWIVRMRVFAPFVKAQ